MWRPGSEFEAQIQTEISEPLLRIDTAANTPYTHLARAQQKRPNKLPLVATPRGALLTELLCHVFGFSALNPIV